MNIGVVKGAGQTISGLSNLALKLKNKTIPGVAPEETAAVQKAVDWLTKHSETHGFFEGAGSTAESVGELLAPELWMGKAAEALKGMSYADRLIQMGKNAKILQKYPGLAKALTIAARGAGEAGTQATLQGTQTYAKTGGDIDQAVTAAIVGGALGGATGAGFEGYNQLRTGIAKAGEEVKPITKMVGDQPVQMLRSELPGATPLQKEAADISGEPAIRKARTAANAALRRDLAKDAMEQLANDANTARPTDPMRVLNPAKRLGAGTEPLRPAGTAAGTEAFAMPTSTKEPQWTRTRPSGKGTNVVETQTVPNPDYQAPEGTLTPGGPGQTVEQAARQIGTTAGTIPERVITGPEAVDTRNAAQMRLDAARGAPERMVLGPETVQAQVERHIPPAAGTGAAPDLSGGGTRVMDSVDAMMTERARIQAQMRDPDTPSATISALRDQLDTVNKQLAPYDEWASRHPHFDLHDVEAMKSNTNSFGDLAHQADQMARTKLERLNPKQLADFEKYDARRAALQEQFDQAVTPEMKQKLMDQMQSVNDVTQQIFNTPELSTRISMPEAQQALKEMRVRDGAQALQNMLDKHMDFTEAEGAVLGRTPKVKNMASFGQDLRGIRAQYGDVLDPLMGANGWDHLLEMGHLADTPEGKDATKGLIKNVAAAYRKHFVNIFGLGGPVALTFALGRAAGLPAMAAEGGIAGTLGARKFILNKMATDPAFAQRMIYAAKNRVSPRIAAPLLASMLTNQMREIPQPQEKANAAGR